MQQEPTSSHKLVRFAQPINQKRKYRTLLDSDFLSRAVSPNPLEPERTLEICNGEPSSQTGSEPPFKRLLTISILRGHQNSSLARLPYFFCCRFRRHYFRPRHRLVTVEPRRAERAIALVAPATRRSNSGEASPDARSVTGQRSNAGKVRKALLHRFPDRCGNLLGRGVSVDVL